MACQIYIILAIFILVAESLKYHPLSDEFIDYINSKQSTWKAGRNFKNGTFDDVKKMLSNVKMNQDMKNYKMVTNYHSQNIHIPESFDARDNWPECKNLIGYISDQSACGSGWAVAATAAMTDRRCIVSNGTLQKPVSAEDLMSCCDICGYGCNGGYIEYVWNYWKNNGIVTGGPYNSSEGCKPYSLEPCEHYTQGNRKKCSELNYDTPTCKHQCIEGTDLDYEKDLTFASADPIWIWQVEDIQRELLINGPLQAGFVFINTHQEMK